MMESCKADSKKVLVSYWMNLLMRLHADEDYVVTLNGGNVIASDKVIAINGGMRSIPVIIFEDGSHLTEPSDNALQEKLQSLNIL